MNTAKCARWVKRKPESDGIQRHASSAASSSPGLSVIVHGDISIRAFSAGTISRSIEDIFAFKYHLKKGWLNSD